MNAPGKVLIVDDSKTIRLKLTRAIKALGHTPVAVESGRDALGEVRSNDYDVILLDIVMPVMDGFQVLERLKGDPHSRDIPVIVISGVDEMPSVVRAIELGAEDFLPKDFEPVLLRARVNTSIDKKRLYQSERDYALQLQNEKDRSERLLRNILPDPVVVRLSSGETIIADRFEDASILFADIVGFTPTAALLTPADLVNKLNGLFSEFDRLAISLGVEKIKTIGDAYMAASGLPQLRSDHAEILAEFALAMLDTVERSNHATADTLQLRIGIHTGPVVAGVIGMHKFSYDVWGDTVNVASRLESQGVAGRVQVSEATRQALAHRYDFESRGLISIRGRGETAAFLLGAAVR